MTRGRIADIEEWLRLCGQDTIPTTEWAHVVRELVAGVKAAHARIDLLLATHPDAPLDSVRAAGLLKVAPRTVCKWADQGRLPCAREEGTGNRLFRRQDVLDFAREHGFDTGLFRGEAT